MDKDGQFSEWANSATPQLLRLARVLMTGEARNAEDLVQDALISVYVRWGRIENADAYARTCLTHKYISSWRSRGKRSEVLRAEIPERVAVDDPSSAASSINDALSLLSSLPRQQRAVVALRYLDDLSLDQIAETLDIAEGTVKKHLSRAMAALRGQKPQGAPNDAASAKEGIS